MASFMSNPPGQVTLNITSQDQGVSTVQALKCTPLVPPPVDILLISGHLLEVEYSLTLQVLPGYGAEKRRHRQTLFPHFFPQLFLTFLTFSCFFFTFVTFVTLFLKGRSDQPSLIVYVWYIPWSRRYLITIFAEHCFNIHDSRYFQGILDNVSNIDIDIIVSVTFFDGNVDKKRHFNNISIPLLGAYQGYQNISWKRHFTNESIPLSERIMVIKTSLWQDISLTNLYPFWERTMVNKTSLRRSTWELKDALKMSGIVYLNTLFYKECFRYCLNQVMFHKWTMRKSRHEQSSHQLTSTVPTLQIWKANRNRSNMVFLCQKENWLGCSFS